MPSCIRVSFVCARRSTANEGWHAARRKSDRVSEPSLLRAFSDSTAPDYSCCCDCAQAVLLYLPNETTLALLACLRARHASLCARLLLPPLQACLRAGRYDTSGQAAAGHHGGPLCPAEQHPDATSCPGDHLAAAAPSARGVRRRRQQRPGGSLRRRAGTPGGRRSGRAVQAGPAARRTVFVAAAGRWTAAAAAAASAAQSQPAPRSANTAARPAADQTLLPSPEQRCRTSASHTGGGTRTAREETSSC